jgi:hypothetical protein
MQTDQQESQKKVVGTCKKQKITNRANIQVRAYSK